MAPKRIVVVGATGVQGGSVVDTFLKEPGWAVRGLTRDTNGPQAQTLTARGVEMVVANLEDVSSLVKAFEGAHAIFGVINFFLPFFNPDNRSKLAPGQNMGQWARDYGFRLGKNVINAAAQTQGLERFVFSALSYTNKWSGGKYTHAYHFDSDGMMVEYAQSHHPELMKKTSIIQIGMYLTNILIMPNYQPKRDDKGVYVFKTKYPGDYKLPMIATEEDTGPLAKALVEDEPGRNIIAYREWMSFNEFVDAWGRVKGVKTSYFQFGPDEPWEGLAPEELRQDIEECVQYHVEFGFAGGDPSVIYPKDLSVPTHLGSVEEWIRKQDWSAVM